MSSQPSLWSQFKKEKWLLLFCFVLAFFAWQGIRKNIGLSIPVSNVTVDVDVPEGWAVWEKSVPRVNIEFRGSKENIAYLNNELLRVVIPVPDPEHGKEIIIPLEPKYLRNHPSGAKVVRFSPSEIVVKLDQEGERQLPVKAALKGSLPEGIEIDRIVCTPASVRVTGARQVLDDMENIHTEPLDLSERQDTFKESVRIALPQAGRMRVEPDWVSVDVFIETRNSEASLEHVPVRILSAPGEQRSITAEPTTIHVTVSGKKEQVERLRIEDVFSYVSCYDLEESTGYDLPVKVDLPAGLQLIKTDPAVVHVEIGN